MIQIVSPKRNYSFAQVGEIRDTGYVGWLVWSGLVGRDVVSPLHIHRFVHLHIQTFTNYDLHEWKCKRNSKERNNSNNNNNSRMIQKYQKKGEQIKTAKYCINKISSQWSLNLVYFIFNFVFTCLYLFIYFLLFEPFILFAIHIPLIIYRWIIGNEIYRTKCVYHRC